MMRKTDDSGPPAAPKDDDSRYRVLIEAITDYAIYMLDPDGLVTSWNPGAERLKGYRADEIIGQHFSRFYTEDDRRAGGPALALKTAADEGRFEKEGWRIRKDGTRLWAHVIIDPIREPSGRLIGYAKITRDLTERRAAEDALRQSEQQFRLLVQGVTDYAIYMLDAGGRVTNWNAGARRIKGYEPDEIVGQHLSQFYTEEDRAADMPRHSLETAAREGRFEKEGWRVRKDGSRFWAHVIIDAIRSDGGELIGFAKVTRDITERREAQTALEAAQVALFHAQKLEAIGQLTGGVAHDFNNLLMAILGSLELARKRLPPGSGVEPLLDNAIKAADRGATLTRRMLAFARRQDLKSDAVDLHALVEGMSGIVERSLGPTYQVRTDVPPGLPLAHTDAAQLESALLNLVVNARDAMPAGGLITLSGRAETIGADHPIGLAPGPYLTLSVIDSGEGMDPDTVARAAEPFFTTKGVGKGTGLGLSMVHGLAEQSGGKLRIESRLGAGSAVEIWLPAAADQDRTEAAPAAPAEAGPALSGRPLVILAVDDDNLVLMNTAAMLEDLGHRVIAAPSAPAALAVLEREAKTIDLVITDQAMPKMTGLELLRAIKTRWPGLPGILATGYAELSEDAADAVPRLAKPFSQRQLMEAVQAAPCKAGAAASLGSGPNRRSVESEGF